jgi:hypothetical protein
LEDKFFYFQLVGSDEEVSATAARRLEFRHAKARVSKPRMTALFDGNQGYIGWRDRMGRESIGARGS